MYLVYIAFLGQRGLHSNSVSKRFKHLEIKSVDCVDYICIYKWFFEKNLKKLGKTFPGVTGELCSLTVTLLSTFGLQDCEE